MILLAPSDFIEYFSIPVSVARETEALLQDFIDRFEKKYIVDLLGATLGELYIADKANVSQEARFVAIEDEFYLDAETLCGKQWHSRGMKDMLKNMVFFHYVSEKQTWLSQNGVTVYRDEAGTVLGIENGFRFGERKFNGGVITSRAIQWYITTYAPSNTAYEYPEYNGKEIKALFSPIF